MHLRQHRCIICGDDGNGGFACIDPSAPCFEDDDDVRDDDDIIPDDDDEMSASYGHKLSYGLPAACLDA